jgi:enoyl-CoA hydratase/carnithine racemase
LRVTFALGGLRAAGGAVADPPLRLPQIDQIVVRKSDRVMDLYGGGQFVHRFTGLQFGDPVGAKRFQGDKAHARHFIARFGAAFEAWMNARFVTIAAINGYAMGGGLECALSCDIRIAESHAQMALPEPAVGLLPAGCGTQMLPWLVGEGWAKRMILTNERVDAATALRIGLVQEVVEKGRSLAAATAIAERVATLSPRAVEFCKQLIHNARNGVPKREGLEVERQRFMDLFDYADTAEGVSAFLDKRKPEWKND